MRFFACVAPWGGRRLFSDISSPFHSASFHFHKMLDLVDHSARRRRVLQLDGVSDPPQPKPANDRLLVAVEPHGTPDQRHLDRPAFRVGSLIRHYTVTCARSASSLPRSRAIVTG